MNYIPGYESLALVLEQAYEQATVGKGAERHARGNPFHEQHMQSISTLLNSDKGMAFQVIKKLTEGLDFTDPERRERELLGVIVYVAGLIVWHRGHQQPATCPDCGAPEGDMHYVLCPRLPVPEAHAEAVEAAFAEQVQFDEARADIIGQNGNEGEHYETELAGTQFRLDAGLPAVNVNDWRTWQVGDVLEAITDYREGDDEPWVIRQGELVALLEVEQPDYDADLPVKVQAENGWCDWPDHEDYSEEAGTQRQLFRFHHRPAKTDE